jgi:hypothetical protein
MFFIAWRADRESQNLHDLQKGNPQTAYFNIEKALKNDFGREVVRMHWSHRPFASRYDVVRVTYEKIDRYSFPFLGWMETRTGA